MPKVLSVNTSDTSGGAARAACRIQHAISVQDGYSRMFVKQKTSVDDKIISLEEFIPQSKIYKTYHWIQNKIKNKLQQYRWKKYPDREDVFMSDLRSVSLHSAFQKIDFDVLHLHWINLRFLNLKELQKLQKPIVWTLHDCWAFTGVCHYFYDCEFYKYRCGDCPFLHSDDDNDLSRQIWEKKNKLYQGLDLHIVTPSNWLGSAAKQSSLFRYFPVTVIPNPIDTDIFTPGEKEEACRILSLSNGVTYLLYGAMNAVRDKNKGFAELITALNHYSEKYNSDNVCLLVVGAEKPIEELQIKMQVHYLGVINDDSQMVSAYRASSVMITPSLSENLSNGIMESLSCGVPVAAFNIGGNSDMIDHKQNGYLAAEKNTADLAAGILWCLENNKKGELSINARKKVEENYSMEIIGKKYLELYDNLVH